MRELIRPALFLVARVGLFFVVVAWIVGQWWYLQYVYYLNNDEIKIACVDSGWIPKAERLDPFFAAGQPANGFNAFRQGTAYTAFDPQDMPLFDMPQRVSGPGVVYLRYANSIQLSIYHWLVVTFFALFYGVLKWVYRKRGTEVVSDE